MDAPQPPPAEGTAGELQLEATTRGEAAGPSRASDNPFLALFLPENFPASTEEGYIAWAGWNLARTVAHQTCLVLSTEALLLAVGVGASERLPLAAVWSWVLKDGLGYAAKLGFGSRFAASFDREPKRWRVACDVLMVAGGLLEVATALFPAHFLPLATAGNAAKAVADAATGAAYRVFLNSLACASNIGDVSAKAESQVVAGQLLGLALGIAASAALGTDGGGLLAAYGALGAAHVAATARASYAVRLRTLNFGRASALLDAFARGLPLPSVAALAAAERFWPGPPRPRLLVPGPGAVPVLGPGPRVVLGAPLAGVRAAGGRGLEAVYAAERFLLAPDGPDRILVALREDAGDADVLRALLQAHRLLAGGRTGGRGALRESLRWARGREAAFAREAAAAGFATDRLLLPPVHHLYRPAAPAPAS